MIHQFIATFSQISHAAALLVILYGVMLLIGAMFANGSPLAFVKGALFVFAGTWFAGLLA